MAGDRSLTMTAVLSQVMIPPRVSRKGYAAKIHTGIDERQEGGPVIVRNGAAADKCLGVSIDADTCAGGIAAAAIVLNLICAGEPSLAVAVEVDAGTGVTGNLDVGQSSLAAETSGNTHRAIAPNGGLWREDGNPGALPRRNSSGFISLNEVGSVVGGELHL